MNRNRLGLLILVLILVGGYLLLAFGCARRPQPPEPYEPTTEHRVRHTPDVGTPPKSPTSMSDTPRTIAGQQADIALPSPGKPSLLQRVFGTGKTKYKNVTIQQVIGDGNKVASGDTKLKDAQQATDSGTLAGPNAQQTVVTGDNNTVKPIKQDTTQEAADWKAVLAGPTGKVLAFVVFCGVVYGGYLLLGWARRRKQAQNLIS